MVKASPLKIMALLAPAFVLLLAIAAWPLAKTVWFSLTDASLGSMTDAHWIGFTNFTRLLRDPYWWTALGNTLFFAIISVTLETIIGLFVAMLLNQKFRGQGLLRAAVLVPWAIPSVVSAKMWAWMLNDSFGVINDVFMRLHLIDNPRAWLSNDTLARASVITVDVWKTTPFMALLILAALQGVPGNLYEAARIEGIPRWKRFWHITLPFIRPALLVAIVFRMLDALRIFDIVYVLMGNSASTQTISGYARQQLIDFQQFGFGSAASFMVFAVTAIITLIYLRVSRQDWRAS